VVVEGADAQQPEAELDGVLGRVHADDDEDFDDDDDFGPPMLCIECDLDLLSRLATVGPWR